jgi:CheY-specific phosphatase CheX
MTEHMTEHMGTPVVEQEDIVRQLVTEASVDMLGACGMPVESIAAGRLIALTEHDLAGFIGFTGRVRGSLIIAASSKTFSATFPSLPGSRPPSPDDLLDWAGEMANQTLGRIKRRFCDRGMDFETSTPTAVKGRQIGARTPAREGIIDLVLTVGDEMVSICFELVPPADGPVFKFGGDPIPCSLEGDLVLF